MCDTPPCKVHGHKLKQIGLFVHIKCWCRPYQIVLYLFWLEVTGVRASISSVPQAN